MRAVTSFVALLAFVLLVTAGAPVASNGAEGEVEFTATVIRSAMLDIGREGPSFGDTSMTEWNLTTRSGQPLGTGLETCRQGQEFRICFGSYDLPHGTIEFGGVQGSGALGVCAGTGRYFGVAGQLTRRGKSVIIDFEE